MPKLTVRNLGLALLLLVGGWFAYKKLSEKRYSTPQAAIAAMLDRGAAALRDGELGDVVDLVSPNYHGGDDGGPSTRNEVKAFLFLAFGTKGTEIRFLSRDIQVTGDTAKVRASIVTVVGGKGLIDGRSGARELEVDVQREDGDWKVTSARVAPLL
jgi:hypothetical protein